MALLTYARPARRRSAVTVRVGSALPGPTQEAGRPDGARPDVVRPDVVRLAFSAQVPTLASMAALVDRVRLDGTGPDRALVLLEVEVALAPDTRAARTKADQLACLDALAGLTWAPGVTRVVATAEDAPGHAAWLGTRVGADVVVLVPLGGAGDVDALQAALSAPEG